jgi:hypothetical protein
VRTRRQPRGGEGALRRVGLAPSTRLSDTGYGIFRQGATVRQTLQLFSFSDIFSTIPSRL